MHSASILAAFCMLSAGRLSATVYESCTPVQSAQLNSTQLAAACRSASIADCCPPHACSLYGSHYIILFPLIYFFPPSSSPSPLNLAHLAARQAPPPLKSCPLICYTCPLGAPPPAFEPHSSCFWTAAGELRSGAEQATVCTDSTVMRVSAHSLPVGQSTDSLRAGAFCKVWPVERQLWAQNLGERVSGRPEMAARKAARHVLWRRLRSGRARAAKLKLGGQFAATLLLPNQRSRNEDLQHATD